MGARSRDSLTGSTCGRLSRVPVCPAVRVDPFWRLSPGEGHAHRHCPLAQSRKRDRRGPQISGLPCATGAVRSDSFISVEREKGRMALGQHVPERELEGVIGVAGSTTPQQVCGLAPARVVLPVNEVHVWFASLDPIGTQVAGLARLLSDDEQLRASRYLFGRDRRRFTVGRALLRVILGAYLQARPALLTFHYGPNGKPALSGRWHGAFEFNLSHSGEHALLAVTRGRRVGVDLEFIRALPDADDMALRCFSARENALIQAAPPTQRLRAFFECWTRKEAIIKGLGAGLSVPLDEFDASLPPGEDERSLTLHRPPSGESRWWLRALAPDPAYAAALALEGEGRRLALRRWLEEWLPSGGQHACESPDLHAAQGRMAIQSER